MFTCRGEKEFGGVGFEERKDKRRTRDFCETMQTKVVTKVFKVIITLISGSWIYKYLIENKKEIENKVQPTAIVERERKY